MHSPRNRVRRQSGFPTFISCQRQDPNVLPKRRQSHQGEKLCDVSTVPLVARWPVFLARRSDADGEPHCKRKRTLEAGKGLFARYNTFISFSGTSNQTAEVKCSYCQGNMTHTSYECFWYEQKCNELDAEKLITGRFISIRMFLYCTCL